MLSEALNGFILNSANGFYKPANDDMPKLFGVARIAGNRLETPMHRGSTSFDKNEKIIVEGNTRHSHPEEGFRLRYGRRL